MCLIARDAEGEPLCFGTLRNACISALRPDVAPQLIGAVTLPDGRQARTVFELMLGRYLDPKYAPENVAATIGIEASTIKRIAAELAHAAFEQTIEIECEWTDWAGRKHDRFIGRPVSMHAMRGISAHSNGFRHLPGDPFAADAAGLDRLPRRLPLQTAVSAPHSDAAAADRCDGAAAAAERSAAGFPAGAGTPAGR